MIEKKSEIDLSFPYVQQIFRIERERFNLDGEMISEEIIYGITSASSKKINPECLMQGIREHWTIENCDHYVKDVPLQEDACRVRLSRSTQILSMFRNLVVNIVRKLGFFNIAEGIRVMSFGSKDKVLRILGVQ